MQKISLDEIRKLDENLFFYMQIPIIITDGIPFPYGLQTMAVCFMPKALYYNNKTEDRALKGFIRFITAALKSIYMS